MKLKQISSCWTELYDLVQCSFSEIQNKLDDCTSGILILLSVAKAVLLTQEKEPIPIDLQFFDTTDLSNLLKALFQARQIILQTRKKEDYCNNSLFSDAIKDLLLIQPRETFTQALLQQTIGASRRRGHGVRKQKPAMHHTHSQQ